MKGAAYVTLVGSLAWITGCGEKITMYATGESGHVCLTVAADNEVNATVYFECLMGDDSSEVSAECSMKLSGDDLAVTASAAVTTIHTVFTTLECVTLAAECSISAVPDGDYTVTYGDSSTDLTVSGSPGLEVCTNS